MERRVIRRDCQCTANQLGRFGVVAALLAQHSEQMQRIAVVWMRCQIVAVLGFGRDQSAATMQFEYGFKAHNVFNIAWPLQCRRTRRHRDQHPS